ncbi:MAG: flagellar basal-body MS-ring/collar protein FliF [Armatimonadota bacterium]
MDQLTKLGPMQAIAKFWGGLSNTQRFMAVVFISTSVVLLLVVSIVATRPSYEVLFSGLEAADAGTIVSKLQESKIPYEIDGSTIKVPEKNVHELRMQLASEGLPKGGTVGFELFDKNNLGMTEFTQKLNYQRALQGELSRTIDEIDNVTQSRVHVVIPEENVFADDKKQPTASVILKLRPGSRLSPDQVSGIVRLVSSAVEGLTPDHVTIVDTDGNMLSEPVDSSTGLDPRMSSSQLRMKGEYEQQVRQDIQSMLERVLGPNKAVVRVNAKINFDRKEKNSELYEPVETNKGVLESEDRMEESYNGSGSAPGGVVGVRPAINGTASSTVTTGGNGYQRIQSNAKYEVSKTTEHVITAPGQLEKISVAVMVDGKVDAGKVQSIRNAVSTAAGIDPQRGDKVTVESIAFDDSAAKQQAKEMAAEESKSNYLSIGKTVGGVLLLFAFLFFLKGMLKQIRVQVPESVTVTEVSPDEVPEVLQGYSATPEMMADVAAVGGSSQPVGAGSTAKPSAEDVAKALRAWMSE